MGAIENALKRKHELLDEVAKIDAFIAQYRSFASGNGQLVAKAKRARFAGPDPRIVADAAVQIIHKSDMPIKRREILNQLERDGLRITAKDPVGYVGVQLWRHAKHRVRAVKGGGFVSI